MNTVDPLAKDNELLANIRKHHKALAKLLREIKSHWTYEDRIYRFYHQSFKVYALQDETRRIVDALRSIAPQGAAFSKMFEEIIQAGAGNVTFEMGHNDEWTKHTRPFVEAFLHAKYFLEMAVKYGKELETAPQTMPSGWAALLCLFNMR